MEIDRFQRNKQPFTVSYIDLDNFKAVNDNFGHNVGDDVLSAVVRQIKNLLRKTDFIARLGGDEFVLILPDTDQAGAQLLISKIQISLLEEMQKNKWPVTFSIGVLTCINIPQTVNELIKQADDLMYSVKNNGKNSINYSIYEELKQK
jgi:diguanylate cyclase (GGDEF)-like protein